MSMTPGNTVVHPQWGRGTVLFDKPHCIGIRFLEYGQVNFSQEEWALQHSPAERFRSCVNELEYALDLAIDAGELSEGSAQELLARKAHILEVRRLRGLGIDEAYAQHVARQLSEEDFYTALKRYVEALVRRSAPDAYTYSNIEDAITESLLEVWQRLRSYDSTRTSLKNFVTIIVRNNIQDQLRFQRASKGHSRHVELDPNITGASKELTAEQRLLFDEWMREMSLDDRLYVQMLKDGLTQEEMALAMRVSQPAVAKRFSRIRQTFKRPF
jgi:RNA polymerase sigma factor (sigma-70 family)